MNDEHSKKISPTRLSEQERAEMRREFGAFMVSRPASEKSSFVFSPFFTLVRSPALYASILFLTLGGTVYAAENSLPKDFLYPVKTEFIEPIVVQLVSLSGTPKGHAHSILVERRLEEAEVLIAEGNLEAESVAILTEKIEESSEDIQAYMSNVAKRGQLDKALSSGSRLETVLEAHEHVLASVIKGQASTTPEAENFIDALEERSEEAKKVYESVEDEIIESERSQLESYIFELQRKVIETIEDLEKSLTALPEEEFRNEGHRSLQQAKEHLERSSRFLDGNEWEEALFNLQEALNKSEKALIVLEFQKNFEIFEKEAVEATSSPEQ